MCWNKWWSFIRSVRWHEKRVIIKWVQKDFFKIAHFVLVDTENVIVKLIFETKLSQDVMFQ